jgi:endonuclease IV
MIHGVEDTKKLLKIRKADLRGFEYVSIHSPIYKGKEYETEYRNVLKIIEKVRDEIGFKIVVIHPEQFENFDLLKEFDLPYAVENMDHRKAKYKNVEDFVELFKDFDTKFVLDMNHVYVNDKTMKLAEDFADAFGDRLVECHVSGFEILHDALYLTKQIEILAAIPNKNLPIIVESGGNPEGILEKEFDYVKKYLESDNRNLTRK